MTKPHTTVRFLTLIGIACVGLVTIGAQGPKPGASSSRPYVVGKNGFGQPDLEGVWANDSITPLQRPAAWAGRTTLTERETSGSSARAGARKQRRTLRRRAHARCARGQAASPRRTTPRPATTTASGCRAATSITARRSSSPAERPHSARDAGGAARRAARRTAAAAPGRRPESRGLSERCITFGVPRFQAAYSSVYQIVQAPNARRVHHGDHPRRASHPARRAAAPARTRYRQWLGQLARAWEGETLVVETKKASRPRRHPGRRRATCTWSSASRAWPPTRCNTTPR